ncbi:MAG: hypothetical protein ACLQLC_16545 [Candidatus Sulfotelmatobacter sp.]
MRNSVLRLLALALLFTCTCSFCQVNSPSNGPLIVEPDSHIVVMEYEAWFGPHAVTFQGTAAKPLLQSPDMQSVGGGYDSADPAVIRQHVAWMEHMGIDAAIADLTNNASCIFNSELFAKKWLPYCSPPFRVFNQNIRDNTGNLFPAWTELGTSLGLIPLLDGGDSTVLFPDIDGKNALEKEIDYFGDLFQKYPDRPMIYEGKPLMVIFLGAAQDPCPNDNPLWFEIREWLHRHPEIENKYTFRMMAGYLDSQPYLWLNQGKSDGPNEVKPEYDFWSWVDRLNTSCTLPYCPYYPSYNQVGARAENLTVSIATAGQYGWGCPNETVLPYCPDDALRYGEDDAYVTLDAFMGYARQLQPIFLIIHQFNEFVPPDEGFDANTDDDSEPANLWGFGAIEAVREQVGLYRQSSASQ